MDSLLKAFVVFFLATSFPTHSMGYHRTTNNNLGSRIATKGEGNNGNYAGDEEYSELERAYINLSFKEKLEYTAKKNAIISALLIPNGVNGRKFDLGAILGTVSSVGDVLSTGASTGSSIIDGLLDIVNLGRAIANDIKEMVEKHEEIRGILKGLLYTAQAQTKGRCNILTMNINKNHKEGLHRPFPFYQNYKFERTNFGVWVVSGGSFTNNDLLFKDDTWGYVGDYTERGRTVYFNNRPCPRAKRVNVQD